MEANTGTCPVCGGSFKMKDGLMVDHGFVVEKGFRKGSCGGVGQKPWEISPEGREHWIAEQKDHRARLVRMRGADPRLVDSVIQIVDNDIDRHKRLVDTWEPKDLP